MRLLAGRSLAYANMEPYYKAAGPLVKVTLALTSLVGAYGRQTCVSVQLSKFSVNAQRDLHTKLYRLGLMNMHYQKNAGSGFYLANLLCLGSDPYLSEGGCHSFSGAKVTITVVALGGKKIYITEFSQCNKQTAQRE